MAVEIFGTCDPAFSAVRVALQENFADGGEVGEAVAVWADGCSVVDLWAGHCDEARSKPWLEDSIACMFSVGKPFAIFALLMLAERGEIELDKLVADYWPQYARAGKETTTIRHIVTHMAGLPGVLGVAPGGAYDWDAMVQAIENAAPISVPGEEGCYHTFTLGHLTGELVRRVSGKSIGRFVREEIFEPLGGGFYFGLGDAELARCADIVHPSPDPWTEMFLDLDTLNGKYWVPLPIRDGEDFNSDKFRRLEMPAYNGHGNARAVARFYAALVNDGEIDGVRLIEKGAIDWIRREQWACLDAVGLDVRMSYGFMLNNEFAKFNDNPDSFGHLGVGGALGFADPARKLAFSFCPNRIAPEIGLGPYARRLIDAAAACV
ncbi:MAG: beta-lactamase family protein [Rhodospirillaceae bacterium]|nr:beta-lactamase family protein [Rhodospirillaceae bacterium]